MILKQLIQGREEELSKNDFLETLKKLPQSANIFLNDLKLKTIDYYSKINITKSIVKDGYVVDCIPFTQQPGVIDLSESGKMNALKLNQQAQDNKFDFSSFDFNSRDCPLSDVGIPRLRLEHLINENTHAFTKAPLTELVKGISECGTARVVSQPYTLIDYTSGGVFVVLGLGDNVSAKIPFVSAGSAHSLNQMWWIANRTLPLCSLEAGWIQSNYFTSQSSTALFAFSTPDGYSGSDYDNYNLQGGFVSYSGMPTLGTPVNEVQYLFEYKVLPDRMGYELILAPYANYNIGKSFSIGYYPIQRFLEVPFFSKFTIGSETNIVKDSIAEMSGKIFGFGIEGDFNHSLTDFDLWKARFTSTDMNYHFQYFTETWGNNFMNEDAVFFYGNNSVCEI